jgi:hypothetical protein
MLALQTPVFASDDWDDVTNAIYNTHGIHALGTDAFVMPLPGQTYSSLDPALFALSPENLHYAQFTDTSGGSPYAICREWDDSAFA